MSRGLKTARLVFFLIAGAALTHYLLSRSGSAVETVAAITGALRGSHMGWFLAAFGLFASTQVLRAWRWCLLSHGHTIDLGRALPLNAVHVGLGHILPLRLADIAVVGLFRRYAGVPSGSGASTVLLAKLMDVIAMGSVLAFSFLTGLDGTVVALAGSVAFAGLLSLFFLPWLLGMLLAPVRAIAGSGRVSRAWEEMALSARISRERRRSVYIAVGVSLASWALKLFMFAALLRSIGVHGIPLWQVFTAGALTDFILALPVHGLLSLGTTETAWVAGFALTGITGALPGGLSVVEAGFSVHLLWLSMAVLLMLTGMIALLPLPGGKNR